MNRQPTLIPKTTRAERLHKILSRAGIASRRTAEAMIQEGRVQVNGETITRLGTTADPRRDRILVDGQSLSVSPSLLYFVLHKPAGVVSTLKDPQGRPTVRELLGRVHERVYPVGRLDYASSGLLLLTNDGELTERLLHPRYQISRTYKAKVDGVPTSEALRTLREGVRLEESVMTAPAVVQILRTNGRKTWIEMTLREGRNREVRRMCEAVGYPVERLVRVQFGPISLTGLPVGAYRPLSVDEVRALRRATGFAPS